VTGRDGFLDFVSGLGLPDPGGLAERFELFHRLLLEANRSVNLFSRATDPEEIWAKHFLDSLLPLKCIDFSGKRVLDLGSGAGLPGIPVKLAVPSCRMTLLDSVRKKTDAVGGIIASLELKGCRALWARLEEGHPLLKRGGFDLVLIRAVKMESRYARPLRELLAPGGAAVFYKARDASDLNGYKPKLLLEQELDYGRRAILQVNRENLN
jgi:16S rRNA (guanine527-N7)-methyltransferase